MRLRLEQLEGHLQKPLLPIYLLSGDEPLQLGEAADAIRAAARAQGYSEREVMHAEGGFDWDCLLAAGGAMSLFGDRKVLDLRLPSAKPGDAGARALSAYAEAPPQDTLLLITSGKLDKRQQQSKWFKALDKVGAILQVWPVEPKALPGWIAERMRRRGLSATPEAARLLAERVEGNLLAAAQEVEKLRLLVGEGAVDPETVKSAVADSARFDIFELVDAALAGEAARCVRILEGLRGEGVEPVLVLWALAREIRSLATMAAEAAAGKPMEQLFSVHRVWDKRKGLVRAGLQRHRSPVRWQTMLGRAARIDRIIKGMEPGNPWDELVHLTLLIAGQRVV